MTRKQKVTLVSIFAAIVVIIAAAGFILNIRSTQRGMKEFQIEIVSERDSYSEMKDGKSYSEYLGEFMRTFEGCEWKESDYGIYITGFDGKSEDMENQYWWCITVNDKEITLGADEIPLQTGDKYTFTLTQGW